MFDIQTHPTTPNSIKGKGGGKQTETKGKKKHPYLKTCPIFMPKPKKKKTDCTSNRKRMDEEREEIVMEEEFSHQKRRWGWWEMEEREIGAEELLFLVVVGGGAWEGGEEEEEEGGGERKGAERSWKWGNPSFIGVSTSETERLLRPTDCRASQDSQ